MTEGWIWGWEAVLAIATVILILGVGCAFVQLILTRRSTNAQLAVEIFRELRSVESKDTLRVIYNLEPDDIEDLDKSDLYRIKSLLDKLDLLGCLVKDGIIDELLAIEGYGGTAILKCWFQLSSYIIKRRHEQGIYCKYVEDFAARTFEYQRKKSPEHEWIKFRRGPEGDWENLVKYYIKHTKKRPQRQK